MDITILLFEISEAEERKSQATTNKSYSNDPEAKG